MEDLMNTALGYVTPAFEFAVAWIIDPANWVQFALLVQSPTLRSDFHAIAAASSSVCSDGDW